MVSSLFFRERLVSQPHQSNHASLGYSAEAIEERVALEIRDCTKGREGAYPLITHITGLDSPLTYSLIC